MDYKKLVKVADSTKAKKIVDSSERYDYEQAVRDDIIDALRDEDLSQYSNADEAYEDLYDKLWTHDNVTGNGSGSYWFNSWKAEEALCHNWDLLADAMEEFGDSTNILRQGAEACDVTIRCYLLGQILPQVLEDYEFGGAEEEVEDEDVDNEEEVTEE